MVSSPLIDALRNDLAVLQDIGVIGMVLLPAFMHLMGRWNWWAPAPLARWHARKTGTAGQMAIPTNPGPS